MALFKKLILKVAIKNVIKALPNYKEVASELVKNNIDDVLAKVEEAILKALNKFVEKK